jgi:hypothetical protein
MATQSNKPATHSKPIMRSGFHSFVSTSSQMIGSTSRLSSPSGLRIYAVIEHNLAQPPFAQNLAELTECQVRHKDQ